MKKVVFIGQHKKVFDELKAIVKDRFHLEYLSKQYDNITMEDLEANTLLLLDFTEVKESWTDCWPPKIPHPKKLEFENILAIGIIERNKTELALTLLDDFFSDFFQYPFDAPRVLGTVTNSLKDIELDQQISSLYQVGIDLSNQTNLEQLLDDILRYAQDFTNSDGGSIYLVTDKRDGKTGEKIMRFENSRSDTLGSRYLRVEMPINHSSIAGHAISTGEILNIHDLYNLPGDVPYNFDSSFDQKNNYRCVTMLTVPMINKKRDVIGALQLINRKRERSAKLSDPQMIKDQVIGYDRRCEQVIRSFASQASIAVETNQLYREIHSLFESFMNASVTAVESRDPTTAGHSRRVSKLSVTIAHHISMVDEGPLKDYNFTTDDLQRIKYAGLLHDFGKIGVNEKILLKPKKLFKEDLNTIIGRLELLKYSCYEKEARFERDTARINEYVDFFKQSVYRANEPGRVDEETLVKLKEMNRSEVITLSEERHKALHDIEMDKLVNARGSLSNEEYEMIKLHVEHSYSFLKEINWPRGYEGIPEIARYHHEKLDGSGYPLGLKGDQIPVESQIMCIADIFDALIASDRPYKTRMPLEKAFAILRSEAESGRINEDILDLMIDRELYKLILPEAVQEELK